MLSPCPYRGSRGPVRGWRLPLLVLLLTIAALLPVAAPAALGSGEGLAAPPTSTVVPDRPRMPGLWMPVTGAVVRGFDARAGPYGPGHRGIDIAAPVGATVRAPAAGRIGFAGPVAGTTWVSLVVAPGVRVTLGPLLDPVPAGRVRSRAFLGRVGPGHRAGSTGGAGSTGSAGSGLGATLHLSVRVDGVYVDPLAYLVDRPRPRLAPLPTPGGLPDR
jgi:murein DD-endopeptidase MepM/ murein hydrolase activator NlpD